MTCRLPARTLSFAAAFALCSVSQAQLLNSWEGGLEDWTPQNSAMLANTEGGPNAGIGVTDGSDSLEVTIADQGFQRWGRKVFSGDDLVPLTTAAQNPLTNRLQFDVTVDVSQVPAGSVTYINQQIALDPVPGSWSQVDFIDLFDGQTNETIRFYAPLSRFSLKEDSTSAEIFFATGSDWGAGQSGKIFVDNFRITPIVPDLNEDMVIDVDDWGIFIGNQLGDLTGNADERFLLGDLDSDGDNDFGDLLIFEAAYDEANGAGAFGRDIGAIPEPGSLLLLLLGCGVVCTAARRRASLVLLALIVTTAPLLICGSATAQISTTLLNSWEGGLEGWAPVTFSCGDDFISLDTSSIGVTDGSQSLAVTQLEDGFCWSAYVGYGGGSAQYNALSDAVDVGIEHFTLEFDVTFDTSSIPVDGGITYASLSVVVNQSDPGWVQFSTVASWPDVMTTETVHVSIPLNEPTSGPPIGGRDQTGWYQVYLGTDGDWGLDPGTIYFDNLTLVQNTQPPTLTLEVDRSDGSMEIKNDNSGGSVDFNYYKVTSPGATLTTNGWDSLDAQNIDAVDLDSSGVAGDSLLEGWDAAGGSGTSGLAEAFLLRSSVLEDNESFSLGTPYNFRNDARDLVFEYRNMTKPDRLTVGNIVYVGTPPAIDGDFNGDGAYDCLDVNDLTAEIAARTNDGAFDLTGDGLVDLDDRDAWLAEAGSINLESGNSYLLGDANLDGVVDVSDFNAWNGAKFTSVAAWCSGDFDANGAIDVSDFNIWNGNKFNSALDGNVSSVPEPTAILMLLWGALCGFAARRGR